jgi:hypothetical protein
VRTYLLDNFFDVAENNLTANGYAPSADGARRVEIRYAGEGEAPIDLLSDEPADVGQTPPDAEAPAPLESPAPPVDSTPPAPGADD